MGHKIYIVVWYLYVKKTNTQRLHYTHSEINITLLLYENIYKRICIDVYNVNSELQADQLCMITNILYFLYIGKWRGASKYFSFFIDKWEYACVYVWLANIMMKIFCTHTHTGKGRDSYICALHTNVNLWSNVNTPCGKRCRRHARVVWASRYSKCVINGIMGRSFTNIYIYICACKGKEFLLLLLCPKEI